MRGPPPLVAVARTVALAIAALAILFPLGRLFVASLRVHEIVLAGGSVQRVAGHVVREGGTVRFAVAPAGDPDGELIPVVRPEAQVVAERDRWSFAHYGDVLRSTRTPGLLGHSVALATGSALLALLLGIPVGVVVARSRFRGRGVLAVLLAAPLLVPPFFAAMGLSTALGEALSRLGLSGGTLQLTSAAVCLGGLLAPIPALLVGRAVAAVPAGLVDAARLAGGRGTALRAVVLPSVRPAAAAAATLVFVVALCDFAVPDLFGVFLPRDAVPVHVFATEIFLQWNKYGNVGRAVATAAPFVLLVLALVALAAALLRRSPAGVLSGSARLRPPVERRGLRALVPWLLAAPVLAIGIVLPATSIAAWGFDLRRVPQTVRETAGLVDDTTRWLRLGGYTAIVATVVAVVLVRAAVAGARPWRFAVGVGVSLPVAVPGMVLMVGTLLAWLPARPEPNSLWVGTLVLVGRFLPYAIAAVGLAIRDVGPGLEQAARVAGASPTTVAMRVWGPLSLRGIVGAFLLVLVLAWRELDAIQLVAPGILPVRIYDKVHFGRTAAVADLSMAYLALLFVPALLAAILLRGRRGAGGEGAS